MATNGVDHASVTSTVIIGAGIVGCATAYYLSRSGNSRPDSIHLVEASPELFVSASGKAAGFLAADWFGPATAELGQLSFRLHRELAAEHNGPVNWGYSPSVATSLAEGISRPSRGHEGATGDWLRDGRSRAEDAAIAAAHEVVSHDTGPAWLIRNDDDTVEIIGDHDSTAQVDPLRLSQCLLRLSLAQGVRLHQPAKAVRVSRDDAGFLSAIYLRHDSGADYKLPCTRLVITAGAWSSQVFDELFQDAQVCLPISSLAGHSLIVKSPKWTSEHEKGGCHAIFTSMHSTGFSPEIFSRVGEEIYIAGLNDVELDLPERACDANVDASRMEELKTIARRLLGSEGAEWEVVRGGLCFRPVTDHGTPILARLKDELLGGRVKTRGGDEGGVFLAAGHGPWGISLSLGTGKVMAELIEGSDNDDLSASIAMLDLVET